MTNEGKICQVRLEYETNSALEAVKLYRNLYNSTLAGSLEAVRTLAAKESWEEKDPTLTIAATQYTRSDGLKMTKTVFGWVIQDPTSRYYTPNGQWEASQGLGLSYSFECAEDLLHKIPKFRAY
jgi:hypothetical protein